MKLDDEPRDTLGELELETESPNSGDSGFDDDERRPNWPLIWVVIILLAALVGVYFGFFRGRQKATEAAAPEATAAPAPAPAAEPAPGDDAATLDLPELDASDVFVRELVGELSEHPRLAGWLATDELLRRFAVAVDNVAEGKSPGQHLACLVANALLWNTNT